MSPLEIPGTSIHIPYPTGKQKCPDGKCKRDFNNPKVRTNGDIVSVHCPHCNFKLKSYSQKELTEKEKESKEKGKETAKGDEKKEQDDSTNKTV